jgi:DNA-binding IclR family transcriptional regulator
MQSLARELRTEVLATVAMGERITVLATEGRPRPQATQLRVGQRIPLMPPIGTVFVAWAGDLEIEAWEQALGPGVASTMYRHLRDALAAVRVRGFSVGLVSEAYEQLAEALHHLADRPKDPEIRSALAKLVADLGDTWLLGETDIDPRRTYDVANISAPVFDSTGTVALALTADLLGRFKGEELRRSGDRLIGSTRLLTKRFGGREPGQRA